MQNKQNGSMSGGDPFFRQQRDGNRQNMQNTQNRQRGYVTNWGVEAASGMGAQQQCGSIASTDLSILQDEMHSEALLYKKCSLYSNYFSDPVLKSLAANAAEHHSRHFNSLQSYLNAHS